MSERRITFQKPDEIPSMLNLITILLVLFLSLFAVVALLERFGKPHSQEDMSKVQRFILPLIGLLFLLQGLRYLTGA